MSLLEHSLPVSLTAVGGHAHTVHVTPSILVELGLAWSGTYNLCCSTCWASGAFFSAGDGSPLPVDSAFNASSGPRFPTKGLTAHFDASALGPAGAAVSKWSSTVVAQPSSLNAKAGHATPTVVVPSAGSGVARNVLSFSKGAMLAGLQRLGRGSGTIAVVIKQSGKTPDMTPLSFGNSFVRASPTGSCAKTCAPRCGPLFKKSTCCKQYPYCNEANGWCGNTNAHRDAQPSVTYDFATCSSAASWRTHVDDGPPQALDRWHVLVWSDDGGRCSMYSGGSLAATYTGGGQPRWGTQLLTLGNATSAPDPMLVGEVLLYDKALLGGELSMLNGYLVHKWLVSVAYPHTSPCCLLVWLPSGHTRPSIYARANNDVPCARSLSARRPSCSCPCHAGNVVPAH